MNPPSVDVDAPGADSSSGSGAIAQLDRLQKTWNNIVLTGKPNGLAEKPDLLTSLEQIGVEFGQLRRELSDAFAEATQREAAVELGMRAQIAIDILVRNLFERTADVGFLAEDVAIIDSLRAKTPVADAAVLRARLDAYIAKYSVYDDIAVYRPDGALHLTRRGDASLFAAGDPMVASVLERPGVFHEVFRPGKGMPSQLLYAHAVQAEAAPGRKELVGVLALSFRFDDEMAGIFADLIGGEQGRVILAIADGGGTVLATSDEAALPRGRALALAPGIVQEVTIGGARMVAVRRPARSYQGYAGLGWSGIAIRRAQALPLSSDERAPEEHESGAIAASAIVSEALKHIFGRAYAIDTDLHLIGLNGKIAADREHDRVLPAVLASVREIGEGIRNAVHDVIGDLYDQARHTLDREAAQMAALGVNIMDRNLYERANDCRWWALTPAFRRILAARGGNAANLSEAERAEIAAILGSINTLYTVYSQLLVFDREGHVVAGSRGADAAALTGAHIAATLANRDPQRYAVSPFEPSPLYDGRPTYLYCGTILAPDDGESVGGVAAVFDSEPQFRQMLLDVLPHREDGSSYPGSFAAFVNRDGVLIASTAPEQKPGHALNLRVPRARDIVARRRSPGYREFKRSDGYIDPVECVIAIRG
jgi:hypothetical protein